MVLDTSFINLMYRIITNYVTGQIKQNIQLNRMYSTDCIISVTEIVFICVLDNIV